MSCLWGIQEARGLTSGPFCPGEFLSGTGYADSFPRGNRGLPGPDLSRGGSGNIQTFEMRS